VARVGVSHGMIRQTWMLSAHRRTESVIRQLDLEPEVKLEKGLGKLHNCSRVGEVKPKIAVQPVPPCQSWILLETSAHSLRVRTLQQTGHPACLDL
jgi:hypothetical protein